MYPFCGVGFGMYILYAMPYAGMPDDQQASACHALYIQCKVHTVRGHTHTRVFCWYDSVYFMEKACLVFLRKNSRIEILEAKQHDN